MTKPKASRTASRTKASATQKPAGKPVNGSKVVRIAATEGMTRERMLAELAGDGVASNAYTMSTFSRATFGDLELTDAIDVLRSGANTANGGDLSAAVTMLSSQAVALNAMFGELARRSALNMGEYIDASERYMRLALKAQGQCRATLETLAAIKNPPVVFARQANINNGGQQQVNNGAPQNRPVSDAGAAVPHASESLSGPNELLEDCTHGGTQLDTRATAAASRANPGLEPVGAFDRSANH